MARDGNEKLISDRKHFRLGLHLFIIFAIAVVVIGVSWAFYGRHFVEKIVTQLILPCGLVWVALFVLTYFSFLTQRKRVSFPVLAIFLFYWTTGCSYTGVKMVSSLEQRFDRIDLESVEPFDLLVVLGGGTRSNTDGQVWLGSSGDRVILAARFFHRGKADRLASTGRAYEWDAEQSISLAGSASRIWQDLGIPNESILHVDGRNTYEEMKNLRELLAEQSIDRVGLLTSAYHLPRAMRLARANGLDLIPVPADQQAHSIEPMPLCLIPSRRGFRLTELVTKEYLAALVRR